LSDDEFRQLEEKVLAIENGALLVISGSLPPGVSTEKLTSLIRAAQQRGIRCIVDSSGEALRAALEPGNLAGQTQPERVKRAGQPRANPA
jgi:6-phosphofructokinase 2